MSKVTQEMYCTKSGGGCGGYIRIKINMELNHVVKVICPNCGHEHQRKIENGLIRENGRWDAKVVEEICPTMAAFRSQEQGPWSKVMFDQWASHCYRQERDAVPLEKKDDYAPGITNREADLMLRQSWLENLR